MRVDKEDFDKSRTFGNLHEFNALQYLMSTSSVKSFGSDLLKINEHGGVCKANTLLARKSTANLARTIYLRNNVLTRKVE